MRILVLFILLACNSATEPVNPNITCADHRACGPDAICAPDESCYKVPGCEKTLCLKTEEVCQKSCGTSECKIMESYPAQIACE